MTENTQVIIRKNGVEIAILNEVLSPVFLQVIKRIDEDRENPLGDEVILKKNKRIEFSPEQVFIFLHNVIFNLCITQKHNIEDIYYKNIENTNKNTNIENKLDQFEVLNYDLSTIENLLASFIYSEKKNKKNEWTYCIENIIITMDDIVKTLYREEKINDIQE